MKLKNPPKEMPAPPPPPPPKPEELPDASPREVLVELRDDLEQMHCSTHELDALRKHLQRLVELTIEVGDGGPPAKNDDDDDDGEDDNN